MDDGSVVEKAFGFSFIFHAVIGPRPNALEVKDLAFPVPRVNGGGGCLIFRRGRPNPRLSQRGDTRAICSWAEILFREDFEEVPFGVEEFDSGLASGPGEAGPVADDPPCRLDSGWKIVDEKKSTFCRQVWFRSG